MLGELLQPFISQPKDWPASASSALFVALPGAPSELFDPAEVRIPHMVCVKWDFWGGKHSGSTRVMRSNSELLCSISLGSSALERI